jgi:hypothetical protein
MKQEEASLKHKEKRKQSQAKQAGEQANFK